MVGDPDRDLSDAVLFPSIFLFLHANVTASTPGAECVQ